MDFDLYKIPKDDYDAWDHYAKYNWVYSRKQLLAGQNVKWSPMRTEQFPYAITETFFDDYTTTINEGASDKELGHIYVGPGVSCQPKLTEVVYYKGEINDMFHLVDNKPDYNLSGDAEIRIRAFSYMHLTKFTGIICFETISNTIYSMHLLPSTSVRDSYNKETNKLIRKIYRKKQISL